MRAITTAIRAPVLGRLDCSTALHTAGPQMGLACQRHHAHEQVPSMLDSEPAHRIASQPQKHLIAGQSNQLERFFLY